MRVCIDPGHGGDNLGCLVGDRREKEITRDVADDLSVVLLALGFDVGLTRNIDVGLSQRERGAASARFGADFVLSLHVNALAPNSRASGIEAYHWPGSAVGIAASRALIAASPTRLTMGGRERVISVADDPTTGADRWLENPRAVVGAHRAPVVLAELFYATNAADLSFFGSREGRTAILAALAACCAAAALV